MRRKRTPVHPATTLPIMILICVVSTTFERAAAEGEQINARLTEIVETRQVELNKNTDENNFSVNTPGIELRFDISTPAGKKVATIEQPQDIRALDSTGKDLSKVKSPFMSSTTFITLVSTWNEPPSALNFRLLPAERSAMYFSLDTTFHVWVYDTIDEQTISPTTEGSKLEAEIFGNPAVTARLQQARNGVHLNIVPGTVKDHIQELELWDGDTKLETLGVGWDHTSVTYMFTGTFKPDLKARIKVRRGLQKLPCRIQITDQALP